MEWQDIRGVDEKIRAEVLPFRVAGDLAQISLQLFLAGAPGEICVRLRKAELSKRFHDLRASKCFRQEDDVRIDRLHFPDQPLPERKWLGVRIIDPKDPNSPANPEQHHVAQRPPKALTVGAIEVWID